jgi:phosphoserine phosphatase
VISNELVVKDGVLTGEVRGPLTYGEAKLHALKSFLEEKGIKLDECIMVGDGANDICLFRNGGFAIAFNAKPILKKYADETVEGKDLRKVIKIIDMLMREDERCYRS